MPPSSKDRDEQEPFCVQLPRFKSNSTCIQSKLCSFCVKHPPRGAAYPPIETSGINGMTGSSNFPSRASRPLFVLRDKMVPVLSDKN